MIFLFVLWNLYIYTILRAHKNTWYYGIMYLRKVRMVTYSKSKDQLGKVVNLAGGQLKVEKYFFPIPVRA